MSAEIDRRVMPAVVVLGLPGRPSVGPRRKGSGFAMVVPEMLVQRWESAYRRYGEASKAAAVSVAGDWDVAWEMASASREVGTAWREMESITDLPWWTLAALGAAAQAFEFQARDWSARAEQARSVDDGGWSGPQRQLPTRPRPALDPRPEHPPTEQPW